MTIPNKPFAQLIQDLVTAWSANVGIPTALQPGDALFATFQAVAAQIVFVEAQAQIVNALARAQTSNGPDLDSWMAQFGFFREPATFETGQVTFGKLSASASAYQIPVGTLVQTPGGAAVYAVVADTSQPTYSAPQNAYIMAPNQTSLTATVQATVAGTGPNVQAGALSQIASPLPGIDTVTNAAPINNAINAESDASFRARFVLYLNSLSKATHDAILSAIENTQQGLDINLLENENPSGGTQLGVFTAVIDDGSGDPPDSLITNIYNAVYIVRGFTIQPFVVKATKIVPFISLNYRVAPGYLAGNVTPLVQTAIVNAVNAVQIDNSGEGYLFISQIEGAATKVPGVAGVQPGATLINAVNADLPLTAFQVPRIGDPQVTVGTY